MHSTSDSSLLVSLSGLHETIAAGYGSAMAYVRTLDDVSFSLRERDLVLVGGAAAAGSAALVAAVCGRRRITRGSRALSSGVRVRRASITLQAARAIVSEWSQCTGMDRTRSTAGGGGHQRGAANDGPDRRVRTAYVLRVRESLHYEPEQMGSWASWARMLYRDGGAVMLWRRDDAHAHAHAHAHARRASDAGATTPPRDRMRDRMRDRVHEPGTAAGMCVQPEVVDSECDTGRVRRVTLAAGRIVMERTMNEAISESWWRRSSW
ncbi:MAG TPA: hypothetical protein VE869_11250 [Gemmatimonas sp.]|nr:hypothetical protein [Gemmatimonas sp.]